MEVPQIQIGGPVVCSSLRKELPHYGPKQVDRGCPGGSLVFRIDGYWKLLGVIDYD